MARPKKKLLWDKIREVREKRKLTQDGLAKKANLPTVTVARIETHSIKNPSIQTLAKITRALEVGMDELIEGLFIEKKDKAEK